MAFRKAAFWAEKQNNSSFGHNLKNEGLSTEFARYQAKYPSSLEIGPDMYGENREKLYQCSDHGGLPGMVRNNCILYGSDET